MRKRYEELFKQTLATELIKWIETQRNT